MGLFQVQRLLYRYETCFSHRIPLFKTVGFSCLPWGRSLIEDVFKVMKGAFSLDKIHRFTLSSVIKIASLGVVLIGIAISLGFRDKGSLQRLAEW